MEIPIIIILLLVLAIIISLIFFVFYLKNKIDHFSNLFFGNKNLIEGIKAQEVEYSETPKSLSGLDSVLTPKINKDFPNINISELKSSAENAILEYYHSLNDHKLHKISHMTTKLTNKIQEDIDSNKDTYSSIKIHRTVLNSYDNKKGLCKITLQTGLEYYKNHDNNKTKIQDRINTEFIYIYDEKQGNISLNCPNCGAPIKELGIKACPYCQTGIVEMFSQTWQIDDIYHK